eukprot:CAMPEP_0195508362 /NCGR_PEP_ID=MMETSP0794_2-20130614/1588_1 /TAXON_ID=515487 /ORGANISM="Stephanopyxis turris, Strain CCMP 815" /LENGTH=112 /DNA_ID=CAMNT_0040635301 /DNA_START=66 /DNA_END=404 /DNA_ORIENTATION=-
MESFLLSVVLTPFVLISAALGLHATTLLCQTIEKVGRGFFNAPSVVEDVAERVTVFLRFYLEEFFAREPSFKPTHTILVAILIVALANFLATPSPKAPKASKSKASKDKKTK